MKTIFTIALALSAQSAFASLKCASTCLQISYNGLVGMYEVRQKTKIETNADSRDEAAQSIRNECVKASGGFYTSILVNSYSSVSVRVMGGTIPGEYLSEYVKTTVNNMKCQSKGDQPVL